MPNNGNHKGDQQPRTTDTLNKNLEQRIFGMPIIAEQSEKTNTKSR